MEAMKFKIESPEHSEAIQKELFRLGCKWRKSGRKIVHLDTPYLVVDDLGGISGTNLSSHFGRLVPNVATTLEELKQMGRAVESTTFKISPIGSPDAHGDVLTHDAVIKMLKNKTQITLSEAIDIFGRMSDGALMSSTAKDFAESPKEFKAMKFRVKSPEHSEAIQRRLFELGFSWVSDGSTESGFQDETFLWTGLDGKLYFSKTWDRLADRTETTLDDLYDAPKVNELTVQDVERLTGLKNVKIID